MKPPKRYKRFPFWLCVILAVACLMSGASKLLATNIYEQAGWWQPLLLALCFGLAAVLLYRRNRASDRVWEQYEADRVETERLLREKLQAEQDEKKARQEEFDRTHGRIFTRLAGVTFDNDDGSSRQAILKDIKASGGGDAELSLEEFEYKGKPAVRVLVDGEQIGNIPRGRVAEILAVLDRIEDARLEVETFRPEEEDDEGKTRRGELIYRADLYLTYTK